MTSTFNPEPSLGPLHGLRVIEFGGIGPGPFAGMMLADMGADVIVVERAADVAVASKYPRAAMNRGKRSVVYLNRFFERQIRFIYRHRAWAILVLILAFGLPVFKLPEKVEGEGFWGPDRLPQLERWLATGPF